MKELARVSCQIEGGLALGQLLKVENWDVNKHNKLDMISYYNGWVKLSGIPLHLCHMGDY